MKPRRSVLSVPGHIEKMHQKARGSRADVIMLDLEDSVPAGEKDTARQTVVQSLLAGGWSEKTITARINGLDTPYGYRDLTALAESAGHLLESIVIPKVDSPADIHFASRLLDGIEAYKGFSNRIGLEAIIESAAGLESISETVRAGRRLQTLVFGVADYSASIGARLISLSGHGEKEEELYPGHRWHFAMSRIVMAAKAQGLMAIDAPFGNFKDIKGLQRSSIMALSLGFDGKWAIHPSQIDTINAVFTPGIEDIQRARRILLAAEEADHQKRGALAVDGRMVDQATVRLARQLWEQAKRLKLFDDAD